MQADVSPAAAPRPACARFGRIAMAGCVAAALLDHGALSGADVAPVGRAPARQLVVLEDSCAQSASAVVRELVRRGDARGHATVLVCAAQPGSVYAAAQYTARMRVLDYARGGAAPADGCPPLARVEEAAADAICALADATHAPVTLLFDSLEALMLTTDASTHDVFAALRRLLHALPPHSRLCVGTAMDQDAAGPLRAALDTSALWSRVEGADERSSGSSSGVPTHATVTVRVHPPEFVRHIYRTYGLLPPTSAPPVWRAAYAGAGLSSSTLPAAGAADPRFWDVVHSAARRGPLGTAQDAAGWWCVSRGARHERSRLHAADLVDAPQCAPPPVIRADELLRDELSGDMRGVGFLELHTALPHGKHMEEFVAYGHDVSGDGAHRLQLIALDMQSRVPSASAALAPSAPAPADPHAALVQSLPFNLGETAEQRARREQVPLPYTYQLDEPPTQPAMRGSTGQSVIFFEPESDDDEDDEDPDDDLDV
ncbi:hypothetical protein MSPP1_000934 [Malassezia sp. CBS 17886]|nr:hypothetical protein MSPP1_000934 [Malassezia sp. CBS 17886]